MAQKQQPVSPPMTTFMLMSYVGLRKDWIDYVCPQLYWHIGFEPADHQQLQRWWSTNKAGKHLYIGHAAYKITDDKQEAWFEPDQMSRQIKMARRNRRIDGSVFFRSGSVLGDPLNIKDTLRAFYPKPALLPERDELSLSIFQAPALKQIRNKRGDAVIKWTPNKVNKEKPPYYYVIYRFPGAGIGDMDDARNILKVTALGDNAKKFKVIDTKVQEGQVYTYMVTAVNRAHTESDGSTAYAVTRSNGKVKKYTRAKRKRKPNRTKEKK